MIGMASSYELTTETALMSDGLASPRVIMDLVDPVDQTGPHCTDQDQRMLGDVLT